MRFLLLAACSYCSPRPCSRPHFPHHLHPTRIPCTRSPPGCPPLCKRSRGGMGCRSHPHSKGDCERLVPTALTQRALRTRVECRAILEHPCPLLPPAREVSRGSRGAWSRCEHGRACRPGVTQVFVLRGGPPVHRPGCWASSVSPPTGDARKTCMPLYVHSPRSSEAPQGPPVVDVDTFEHKFRARDPRSTSLRPACLPRSASGRDAMALIPSRH